VKIDKNLSREMINKYGEHSQLDIVVEEFSELIKEVIKYKRTISHGEDYNIEKLEEELADSIVVQEIVFSVLEDYGISRERVLKKVLEKQKRTRSRYLDKPRTLFDE
jgi:NTP pyrophosphatase (non-canonical NTP hydrolase)